MLIYVPPPRHRQFQSGLELIDFLKAHPTAQIRYDDAGTIVVIDDAQTVGAVPHGSAAEALLDLAVDGSIPGAFRLGSANPVAYDSNTRSWRLRVPEPAEGIA